MDQLENPDWGGLRPQNEHTAPMRGTAGRKQKKSKGGPVWERRFWMLFYVYITSMSLFFLMLILGGKL